MPLKSASDREVVPYASVEALVRALDQGEPILGFRFGAGNMEISVAEAELAADRARHDLSIGRTLAPFLALLMSELPAADAARVFTHLSSSLLKNVREHWPSSVPPSKAVEAKGGSVVVVDGILEPAPHDDNDRPFFSEEHTVPRLGNHYTVYRMRDDHRSPANTLVLGSYWWRIPVGYSVRIAAQVRWLQMPSTATRGSASGVDSVRYLAPQFYWLKTTPLRREGADVEVTFNPLRDALRHAPARDDDA